MNATNVFTFCAVALFAGLLVASTANAGNSGGSHTVSAPQQKSVRQSADTKLPNKPPASRKLQKRDAAAVKTQAGKQVDGDYHKATTVVKTPGARLQSNADYLKSAIGAQGKSKNTKQQDDLEKQKQEKAKELQDQREQEAKEHGLENRDPNAPQQSSDPNPFSDPIGYVEKQIQDGTTSHGSQPNRSDNFIQDVKDITKAASDTARTDNVSQDVKGFAKAASGAAGVVGNGRGFGETAKDAMDKATKD